MRSGVKVRLTDALLPAGMQGDCAQVIFAGLEDLKRFLGEQW